LQIIPQNPAPQGPAQVIPVPGQNGVQAPAGEAPGAQAGITNPETPAESAAVPESRTPQPTDPASSASETASASASASASETAARIVIEADTTSASAEAPTGVVLILATAGTLIAGLAAAAYWFILRPRQLARRNDGHRA
jgi:hypothetical protein